MKLLKILLVIVLLLSVTAQQLRGNNEDVDGNTQVKQCSCGKGKPSTLGQPQKVSLMQYQEALKKLHDGMKEYSSDFHKN